VRWRVGFAFVFVSAALGWACSTFESSDEAGSTDAGIDATDAAAADTAPPPADAGNDVRTSLCATIDAEHCEDFDKGNYPWTFTPLILSPDAAATFTASDVAWSPPSSLHIVSSMNSDALLTWAIPLGPNGVVAECRVRIGVIAMTATDDVFGIAADPKRGVSFGYDINNVPTMFVNITGKGTEKHTLSKAVGEWSRIELEYLASGSITLRVDGVEAATATGSVVDGGPLAFSVGALTLGSGGAEMYVDDCAAYPK